MASGVVVLHMCEKPGTERGLSKLTGWIFVFCNAFFFLFEESLDKLLGLPQIFYVVQASLKLWAVLLS